jgi:XTP/dITP diphosphohydrolase
MRLSNKILLATLNRDKFEEFRTLFSAYPDVELVMADQFLRNPEKLGFVETHDTYIENAMAKARLANQGAHYATLADDSGLEVEALGGKPGVRSHRYASATSGAGPSAASTEAGLTQDQANVRKLLTELSGKSSRQAKFVCSLALLIEGIMIQATGTLEGTITDTPRGTNGFGYDPIFVPKGSSRTFAEMTNAEKNMISHRAKALHELMAKVKNHGIVVAKP